LVIIDVQMEQNSLVEQTSIKYNIPRIWSNRWGKKTQHGCPAWLDLYQTFQTKTHQRTEERKKTFPMLLYLQATNNRCKSQDRPKGAKWYQQPHKTAQELHKITCKVLPFDCHLRVWAPFGLTGNGTQG
jgi:hypothetical protein